MPALRDPRERGPKPPFSEPKQPFPGLEEKLVNKPDYGKDSYRGDSKLAGRKALITGGDSGIGRAVALAYAREGADVVISYLPEEENDAQQIIADIKAEGRTVIGLPGDIRSEAYCKKLIEQTVAELGGLDILVNNAAYQHPYQSLEEITTEEWNRAFETNITAMFYLCKAAISHLQPGASIINTASVEAYDPDAILLPYATTKGAIVNFTKSLSSLLIQKGIRVNAVAPGPIWSPLNPMAMPEEMVKEFGKSTPMGRPGQPVELSPVYVLLASDDASYVTGAVYEVTGGSFTS